MLKCSRQNLRHEPIVERSHGQHGSQPSLVFGCLFKELKYTFPKWVLSDGKIERSHLI
jgi:hypothetical protein